tara:strand:- start:10650 stop:11168 length:519 start_codon:yes stop_codon:yes gene_type:complete
MKNLLFIIGLTLTLTAQAQKVKLVDTMDRYKMNIERLDETGDCTVRAIAEGFNMTYMEAYKITQDMGRVKGTGMGLRAYVRGLSRTFYKDIVHGSNVDAPTNAQGFVDTIAEDGYSYIVVSAAHTFVIEQGHGTVRGKSNVKTNDKWFVKGNYDDKKKDILMYVKIKNDYKK